MYHPEDAQIYWYDPDPRCIIPLPNHHVPKRLRRALRQAKSQEGVECCFDRDFRGVMEACAKTTPDRPATWINDAMIDHYCALHRAGFAHSSEVYMDGQLVGGVYGVAIGGLFAGESMFSRVSNASKFALVQLLDHVRDSGFRLFDVQFMNPHLEQFGACAIARASYHRQLARALQDAPNF